MYKDLFLLYLFKRQRTMSVKNLSSKSYHKSNAQRYYDRELKNNATMFDSCHTVKDDPDLNASFISARHADEIKAFERHWIASLEQDIR